MKRVLVIFIGILLSLLAVLGCLLLLQWKSSPQSVPEKNLLLTTTVPASVQTEPTALREVHRTEPPEVHLPLPKDIPEGPECPGVHYRRVSETVYAAHVLYVRSGPGTDSPVIGRLPKGASLYRGAIGSNGWSQVQYDGGEAYASTIHLSVTPVSPDPEDGGGQVIYEACDDVLYAIDTNKLRTGPGFEYAVIGHLVKGSGAHRVAIGSNGWSRVIFHDTEAYACTSFLSSQKPTEIIAEGPVHFEPVREPVYATGEVNVRTGPGTDYNVLGQTIRGEKLQRTGVGSNGWSRVTFLDQEAYISSPLLSLEPVGLLKELQTSEPELPTPNSPFRFQYVVPDQVMPFGIFTPVNADPSKPLPLILSLHGALEIGEGPDTLKANFLTKEFRNWEYTGLQGFDAIIVCPQLTGYGLAKTWSEPETADKFFALLAYLKENYPVDPDRISIEGHSLGGQGALYMAADPRACFSAVVLVSAYDPMVPYSHVHTAVKGYTGSPYLPMPREDWTSYHFMEDAFGSVFGLENWTVKNCSHYDIPMVALHEDGDENGCSDLIEWILQQSLSPH